mmetsp:Transcript_5310/g.13404  ORF Transcript_5310/g.13404 Transcript_5310/m.13404 type:complete len:282 (+) Transcript_5310:2355-3200(+)
MLSDELFEALHVGKNTLWYLLYSLFYRLHAWHATAQTTALEHVHELSATIEHDETCRRRPLSIVTLAPNASHHWITCWQRRAFFIIIIVVVDIDVAIIHHCHCPRIFLLDHHIIVFTAAGISCRCNLCATHELFNSLLSFVKRLRTTKLQPVAKAVKDVIDLKLDVHRKRTDTNVCICTRIWSFWLCNVLRIRLAFLLLTILFDNRRQLLLWWRWRTVHRCDAVRLPQDKSLKESHEFVEKQAALRIPANAAMRTSQESADKTNAKAVHHRLVSNVLFGWI